MEKKQIVIKLDIVDIDKENNTYFQYTVGYYSSYEMVESVMPALFVVREEALFLTEEIQIDTITSNEDYYKDYVIQRQYRWVDDEIKMIHETPFDFKGYEYDEDYQYKIGDIIQYLDNKEKLGVAIVGGVPPKQDKKKKMYFDFTDDSYLVYRLGNGDTHDHISTCEIVGLAEIRPEEYKAYKDKLAERMKFW